MIPVSIEAANGKGYKGNTTGPNRLHGSDYRLKNVPRIGERFSDGERGSGVVKDVIYDRAGYITLVLK